MWHAAFVVATSSSIYSTVMPHDAEQVVALVVGQDAESRAPVIQALEGHCVTHEASTLESARVLLAAITVHVLFTADVLPDGDGADLCAFAATRSPATARIVFGTPQDAARVVRAMQHGQAQDFLTGAPAAKRVQAALKQALAHYRACATDCTIVAQLRGENATLEKRVDQRTRAMVELNEQLRDALDQVHLLTPRDDLTGLLNRRALNERLEEELRHARRYQTALSCLWCDVLDFRAVNDTAGRELGDAMLTEIAQRLRDNVRSADIPARAGSDAFVVVLPHTDSHQALMMAERLRTLLVEHPYTFTDAGVTLRLTFGIAEAVEEADNGSELLDWAAQAEREAREADPRMPFAVYQTPAGAHAFSR
jgi:diguanylate cyclase (GGDEF)-like protein